MLKIVGKTPDGRLVVRGVFRFYETEGVPLEVLFDFLNGRRMIPDWIAYVEEATGAGMAASRVLSALNEAIFDSFGKAVRDEVLGRLRKRFA